MDIRRNHRDLTGQQKDAFINAILKLKNETPSVLRPGQQFRYDDFVQIHKNSMGGSNPLNPNPHGSPLFYPWHRVLIRQFELALQEAAQDTTITLPYWNWQLSGADNPFTEMFMGGNGDSMQNQQVATGAFALAKGRFEVRVWEGASDDRGLRRNFATMDELPSAVAVLVAQNRLPYWSNTHASGWENFSEATLHNPVHGWIGGSMAESTSPNDPIFFLHHCYLDLLWERWKQQHPNTLAFMPLDPVPSMSLNSRLIFNPDNEPAPWAHHFTVEQVLNTPDLNYGYDDI